MSGDPLSDRIADLEFYVSELLEQVSRLTAATDRLTDEQADGVARPAWSLEGLNPGQLNRFVELLCPWMAWLLELYVVPSGPLIPSCWAEHPGLVAELLTLHESWRAAFLRPRGVEAAQRWHDQQLPGLQSRVAFYVDRDCLAGHHRHPDRKPTRRST
jgi:hypothetical protein